jgi:hypothetical protein
MEVGPKGQNDPRLTVMRPVAEYTCPAVLQTGIADAFPEEASAGGKCHQVSKPVCRLH